MKNQSIITHVKIGHADIPIRHLKRRGKDIYEVPLNADGNTRKARTFQDLDQARVFATMAATQQAIQLSRLNGVQCDDLDGAIIAASILKPFAAGVGISLEQAVKEYCAAKRLVGSRPLPQIVGEYLDQPWVSKSLTPLNEAIEYFMKEMERRGYRQESLRGLRSILVKLAAEVNGASPVGTITKAHLHKIIHHPDGTRQRNMIHYHSLRMLFSWMQNHGYLPPNLLTAMDQVERVVIYPTPPQLLSVEMAKQILTTLSKQSDLKLTLATVLALFAGLRFGEIQGLVWADIIPAEGIHLSKYHSAIGIRRLVPLPPVLNAWLEPFYGRHGYVLNSARAHTKIVSICRKAGIAWRPNFLRHAYLTYRIAVGHDANQVAKECGFSSTLLLRHFHRVVAKDQADAYFSLTPEACGILDWAVQVRAYLSATPQCHNSENNPVRPPLA